MAGHMRTGRVAGALDIALGRRRPGTGLIHHSGRGAQCTSLAFGCRLREAGIAASMGSVGDCHDKALAESLLATLEVELIGRSDWATMAEARAALGCLSPDQCEEPYRSSPAVEVA